MRRRLLVLILGMVLSGGCGGDGSDGAGGGDAGSGDTTSACDDCLPGTTCVADACVPDEPDHWDCGGGAYCASGQIWFVPVGDDPDAEDPCAPSLQETCEHGCDESAEVDPYDDTGWCLPAPCSPEAHGLEGTPVDFEVLTLPCEAKDSEEDLSPEDEAFPDGDILFATSADEILEHLSCEDGPPELDVDFTLTRVAIIKGVVRWEPLTPSWVVEVDGTIWVDISIDAMGGALPDLSSHLILLALPAGDAPVQAQHCTMPQAGPAMP